LARVRSDRWALSTQFRADAGTVEHETTLPDARDERECAGVRVFAQPVGDAGRNELRPDEYGVRGMSRVCAVGGRSQVAT
jgi:hypothetical protein